MNRHQNEPWKGRRGGGGGGGGRGGKGISSSKYIDYKLKIRSFHVGLYDFFLQNHLISPSFGSLSKVRRSVRYLPPTNCLLCFKNRRNSSPSSLGSESNFRITSVHRAISFDLETKTGGSNERVSGVLIGSPNNERKRRAILLDFRSCLLDAAVSSF